ncbi:MULTISPECIES: hypothetical protein [Actinomadura]|uniref:Uncharacterized protein n=1 Tax=Actinomadura yumaensis TaxID=111807 RepID=A0ABW2CZY6_9ACTN|nr:hypothetical protein [Actinomadura sp. J1-007]MWK34200.1 hypothetical protein [Actinomadura sp. J1-007]
MDAADLPGLPFPVGNGPRAADVVGAVRRLLESGRVAALDIACPWGPVEDAAPRARLLAELTGQAGRGGAESEGGA